MVCPGRHGGSTWGAPAVTVGATPPLMAPAGSEGRRRRQEEKQAGSNMIGFLLVRESVHAVTREQEMQET